MQHPSHSFRFILLCFLSLHPLIQSQRTNPTALSGEQVCVTSTSLPAITGTYTHSSFDSSSNGAIFYNSRNQHYLYPQALSARAKHYLISTDPAQTTAVSTCNLPLDKSLNVLNPDDCFTHWSPTDVSSVNCNDICISGSAHDFLDGTYEWIHFNTTTLSSVYHCKACIVTAYLFGYVYSDAGGTHHNWRIGPNYPAPAAWSSCWIKTNVTQYKFDINDCLGWDDAIRFQWIDSPLSARKCIDNVVITTVSPTANPSMSPTQAPSASPTANPSIAPVVNPTASPSEIPSAFPTKTPILDPTIHPSLNPTDNPTERPTGNPTNTPSNNPTRDPTETPTVRPTNLPSVSPINRPVTRGPLPTVHPFRVPTLRPFPLPTIKPSADPTITPSRGPSDAPSIHPSVLPTLNPSYTPTVDPSHHPTVTGDPSRTPTIQPSYTPTVNPSQIPTTNPSDIPSYTTTVFVPTTNDGIRTTTTAAAGTIIPIVTANPSEAPTVHPIAPAFEFPTHKPTFTPSHIPTPPLIEGPDKESSSSESTTEPIGFTTNLVINTHPNIDAQWVAFSISHPDLSCGGDITALQIMDRMAAAYEREHDHEHWISSSSIHDEWYEFQPFMNTSFVLPISIQIHKDHPLETLESAEIIDSWHGSKQYDFGSNFCKLRREEVRLLLYSGSIDAAFHYFVISICVLFIAFGFGVFVDGKCLRRNDYFDVWLFVSSLIHVLCLMSYLFFVNDIFGHLHGDKALVLIFGLSIVFIIVPIIISFGYLFKEKASPYWLFNDRIREWMSRYTALLYFYSVITGSSFTACDIFNSNIFGLDLFFMGVPKQFLYKFRKKRVIAVCFFSNGPQIGLIVYYAVSMGYRTVIPLVAMVFSVLSIGCTLLGLCTERAMYNTRNHVCVTLDVTGPCMFDNKQLSTNRIRNIKKYLCGTVFQSINMAAIQFMRPHYGMITNGLQIQIHIANTHDMDCMKLEDSLNSVVDMNTLHAIVQKEWKLSSKPKIGNISVQFVTSNAVRSRRERYGNEAVVTEEEDDDEEYLSNDVSLCTDWSFALCDKDEYGNCGCTGSTVYKSKCFNSSCDLEEQCGTEFSDPNLMELIARFPLIFAAHYCLKPRVMMER